MPGHAKRTALLLCCILTWPAAHAATQLEAGPDPLGANAKKEQRQILAVDRAFVLTAELSEDGFLVATWRMPAGYYLYRHRFAFSGPEDALGDPIIPDGEPRTDEFFGDVEVYYGEVTIRLPVLRQATGIEVTIGYQGCADFGFCYPPEKKHFAFPGSVP
ncbi:MAG: protein-disulfide reductase DsbD family protein [Gammaproteobacteria bacterium]|nr:protein-disulfide reductase DsbD family protein [Gammaproteobacteria bacterium]